MRTWVLLATTGAFWISGCTLKSEEDRFREGIPNSEEVALRAKSEGGDVQKQSAGLAPLTGSQGTALFYAFTRDITRGIDGGTAAILGIVWAVVHTPPTEISQNKAVWGPGRSSSLEPVVWRLSVTEVAANEYDYVLHARPAASQSEADYRSILVGHGYGVTHALHRSGNFSFDSDALRALDPSSVKEEGTTKVTYDGRTFPRMIHAESKRRDGRFWDATVEHASDGAGTLRVVANDDLDDSKQTKREDVTVQSRWSTNGAGRADVDISGGDLPVSSVRATECWNSGFARSYYTDNAGFAATSGNPASCVFPAAQ